MNGSGVLQFSNAPRRRAFTLVELMVVVAILAVLLGAVLAVTSSTIANAKARQTQAVMLNIQQAIEQFQTDAPLKRVKDYRDRYGVYPCDELEPFVRNGANRGRPQKDLTAPLGRVIGPGADSDLNVPANGLNKVPDRSIKAMALAIRLYSSEGSAILDRISPKYRRPPMDRDEFFDRDASGGGATLDIDDEPLIYFVDAWGTPFEYFAVSPADDTTLAVNTPAPTDLAGNRLDASRWLVDGRNRGKPLLVSYGPDGPDQFSADFSDAQGNPLTDLVADYDASGPEPHVIDDPLNDDNVYIDDTIKERLRQQ